MTPKESGKIPLEEQLRNDIEILQETRNNLRDIEAKKDLDPSIQRLITQYEQKTGISYQS